MKKSINSLTSKKGAGLAAPASGRVEITADSSMYVLRLINHLYQQVGEGGAGSLTLDVPPGLYIARCETGGEGDKRMVRVQPGATVKVEFKRDELPPLCSAAPVIGAANIHDYYKDHVRNLTVAYTADAVWGPPLALGVSHQSRLVVMTRRLQGDSRVSASLHGFRLLSETGAEVTNFERQAPLGITDAELKLWQVGEAQRKWEDESFGRDSFSIDLPAGGYLLMWPTQYGPQEEAICVPVYVPERYVGCLFLKAGEENVKEAEADAKTTAGPPLPAPGELSFQLAEFRPGEPATKRSGFYSGDYTEGLDAEAAQATELALSSLRTGRRQLSDAMLQQLLLDKFRDPMSGVLGAYMLCERPSPNWTLFQEVMRNLRSLVHSHPDLPALEALAASRGWQSGVDFPPPPPISFPPMLQQGLAALGDMAWREDRPTLAENSLAMLARINSYNTGPWTAFSLKLSMLRRLLPSLAEPQRQMMERARPACLDLVSTVKSAKPLGVTFADEVKDEVQQQLSARQKTVESLWKRWREESKKTVVEGVETAKHISKSLTSNLGKSKAILKGKKSKGKKAIKKVDEGTTSAIGKTERKKNKASKTADQPKPHFKSKVDARLGTSIRERTTKPTRTTISKASAINTTAVEAPLLKQRVWSMRGLGLSRSGAEKMVKAWLANTNG